MELNVILLIPDALIVGWQYYEKDEKYLYAELNLYFFFFQIQYRWV